MTRSNQPILEKKKEEEDSLVHFGGFDWRYEKKGGGGSLTLTGPNGGMANPVDGNHKGQR